MTASVCQIVDLPKTARMKIIWQVINTDARIMKDAITPLTVDTWPMRRTASGAEEAELSTS
jgi:hypothetical protein